MNTSTPSPDIRVVLVDDSAVVRGLLTRILQEDAAIGVVGSFPNGHLALQSLQKLDPDVVVLDIEMPVMDGITALPKMLKLCPETRVLMCSSLSIKNAEITLRAMELGATDCIAKPSNNIEMSGTGVFKQHLLQLVKSLAARRKQRRFIASSTAAQTSAATRTPPAAPAPASTPPQAENAKAAAPTAPAAAAPRSVLPKPDQKPIQRENASLYQGKPAIVAIGSSTGGPQALFQVMKSCKGLDVPIVITQHMPPTFTTILAQHITSQSGIPTFEAAEGMVIEPGKAYVAPGGFHMKILKSEDGTLRTQLTTDPPENFCRPSVEPMLRSVLKIFGQKTLAVILTGMGQDGVDGCRELAKLGGKVIAQDEATSVVWGMPGAVANAGAASSILPLDQIGPAVRGTVIK